MQPLEYITLSPQEVAKLLSAGSGDAALVYLYLRASGDATLARAGEQLHMSMDALGWAQTLLGQLGLLEAKVPEKRYDRSRAPTYTGEAVSAFAAQDPSFSLLQGEISRRLGRPLSSEELKTLLAIRDYLKLPPEVVSMALTYCLQRVEYQNRTGGGSKTVTMRSIERTCYAWANQGIVTLEAASDYISRNLRLLAPESQVKKALQLDRPLTDPEREYVRTWLGWGFEPAAIKLAYEKTVLSTGKLAWRYLSRILQSWHEKGLHTVAEIQSGDRKPQAGQSSVESELRSIADLQWLQNSFQEG